MQQSTAEAALRTLVAEIETYVACLKGPGIASVLEGTKKWAGRPSGQIKPRTLPACAHLDSALQAMDKPSLAKAIADAHPFLKWITYDGYPREDIGAGFADNHAFASIIGEGCPFEAVDFDLGLFIIAPRIFYRDHHHAAPELYAPLTGPHGWRFKPGDPLVWKEADVPVWNNPWEAHATMTGDTPFLAIFCWTRDTSQLAKIIPSPDWPTLENPS
ncbi:MAG: dimethylsulfonioproprionate lyase family protein [Aestuariivirga sp.]